MFCERLCVKTTEDVAVNKKRRLVKVFIFVVKIGLFKSFFDFEIFYIQIKPLELLKCIHLKCTTLCKVKGKHLGRVRLSYRTRSPA